MPDLQEFGKNLWIADGPLVRDMGLLFPTRMTVAKLATGDLWVSSPVPVSPETLAQITAKGRVRYLVAGTPRHVWRLFEWHKLFPEAELWQPKPAPMTLRKGHLPFTGILGDTPPKGWAAELDQLPFKGNPLIEEVIFFHKPSRTVILDDLIANVPPLEGRPLRNAVFRLAGGAYPNGGVPLDGRLTFVRRQQARQSLEKLLSWDFDKLIIAHGPCVEKDAKPFVERAFRWLSPSVPRRASGASILRSRL
jgi:hypothetical protein